MLTLDKIYHAAFVLKDVARKTDLIEAPKLSKDCQLYLKTENLQATGSFKVRGAYYKISQLFYKCTRHTVLDFINSYRINQSVLLIAEGHSLTFISESVGFSSPPHYTKVFKKYMGVTPRDYRKTLLDTIPLGSP